MRAMLSGVLIAILNLALVEAPVVAAPAARPSVPLGVVLTAQQAHARRDAIYSGATIYDGDRLQTSSDGTLEARLGPGEIALHENS